MIRALIDWWRRRKAEAYREWTHVPNPEWRAKRGGEYW
jgi:hypothetical protein